MAEPFVESPEQAIDLVERNDLDALLLEQYLIRKRLSL
jgi:predicted NodU family carbamoyl transferase